MKTCRSASRTRFEQFEGCGHALFVYDAPRFDSLLDDFLKELAGK